MAQVMDASALVRLVVPDDASSAVDSALARAGRVSTTDFALVECANALWKHAAFGALSAHEAFTRLDALSRLDLVLQDAAPLLPAALEIAIALRHPVYDCLYVALAMAEDADLVTCDRRLAQAARAAGLGDRVTLIEG
jgi:predicted nucleic acid-binding protein